MLDSEEHFILVFNDRNCNVIILMSKQLRLWSSNIVGTRGYGIRFTKLNPIKTMRKLKTTLLVIVFRYQKYHQYIYGLTVIN